MSQPCETVWYRWGRCPSAVEAQGVGAVPGAPIAGGAAVEVVSQYEFVVWLRRCPATPMPASYDWVTAAEPTYEASCRYEVSRRVGVPSDATCCSRIFEKPSRPRPSRPTRRPS